MLEKASNAKRILMLMSENAKNYAAYFIDG